MFMKLGYTPLTPLQVLTRAVYDLLGLSSDHSPGLAEFRKPNAPLGTGPLSYSAVDSLNQDAFIKAFHVAFGRYIKDVSSMALVALPRPIMAILDHILTTNGRKMDDGRGAIQHLTVRTRPEATLGDLRDAFVYAHLQTPVLPANEPITPSAMFMYFRTFLVNFLITDASKPNTDTYLVAIANDIAWRLRAGEPLSQGERTFLIFYLSGQFNAPGGARLPYPVPIRDLTAAIHWQAIKAPFIEAASSSIYSLIASGSIDDVTACVLPHVAMLRTAQGSVAPLGAFGDPYPVLNLSTTLKMEMPWDPTGHLIAAADDMKGFRAITSGSGSGTPSLGPSAARISWAYDGPVRSIMLDDPRVRMVWEGDRVVFYYTSNIRRRVIKLADDTEVLLDQILSQGGGSRVVPAPIDRDTLIGDQYIVFYPEPGDTANQARSGSFSGLGVAGSRYIDSAVHSWPVMHVRETATGPMLHTSIMDVRWHVGYGMKIVRSPFAATARFPRSLLQRDAGALRTEFASRLSLSDSELVRSEVALNASIQALNMHLVSGQDPDRIQAAAKQIAEAGTSRI